MTDQDLQSYADLSDRWARRLPPFDGIAYSRDGMPGIPAAVNCVQKIVQAVADWGARFAIIGDDYFDGGELFYPSARVEVLQVAVVLAQSDAWQESMSGFSPDCCVSVLAEDHGWLLRLSGYAPDESNPESEIVPTLFVSRASMVWLDSLEAVLGQDCVHWRRDKPPALPG